MTDSTAEKYSAENLRHQALMDEHDINNEELQERARLLAANAKFKAEMSYADFEKLRAVVELHQNIGTPERPSSSSGLRSKRRSRTPTLPIV